MTDLFYRQKVIILNLPAMFIHCEFAVQMKPCETKSLQNVPKTELLATFILSRCLCIRFIMVWVTK